MFFCWYIVGFSFVWWTLMSHGSGAVQEDSVSLLKCRSVGERIDSII